ncbi:uncharacterized protein MONOS_12473 [Monocercomonoides exilis]|uniref:uncharacterized protein n=1 Tax=Monocercomonoides exilis TaxID=2049356 RepID=UPI00355AAFE8|nr:hypothetical protein MONOS_12473 [Monocercomonoides exilis]|eukprot:MONOS_12473.1-p1 / transcript=MONOS_12473.1 / gene=MONOS_12473 / organism=Monocercomonoides_exilis_PA203 / gene_product=unspecified product / transcript_product=unspecified product / location=Mono_scaffold00693:29015-31273(-) / protein_length=603 / sequence_SO=supercontig / SO=protein_coding / is_pseudo=false
MERASFEELKNNHPKESKDAHMELRTSDPLLYSQSVVNLAVNDDYTQVHQSRTLSVKSPSSQRSAFESTDNILSSSFCEDCFEENILKWKPDPTKREQFCHDQEYEVEGTKQSNVAAFRRDEILERWRSEDTEYVQSVQGQLKMTENYGKASAGRSGQFTGLEGNFDQLHGQKKECIEEDTEENCMITNKIRSFGGFKFKRAEELDRKEVVRRQIREAKEHKRLFGEWVAKDWVVDEEEREMWEEAERKLAQTNENDEECLRYDGDATCLMTLEELKTRLKELEMEGKSEMEEEAEAGAEEEAEKGAEEMVEELMDQKKALNLEEEMDSKEKEERKKAREAKEKERMAIKKLIQKREQKEEKRQRLTKISELDRFLIQVGTEKQAQRKKWISEKQINEAKLELNEEEEERKNDFCLEQAELSTIDNKNEFCPSLTSILSLTPPPFRPINTENFDATPNFVLQQAQLNEPYSKFERTIVADTEEMTIRKSLKSCKAKAFSKQWKEISECCDGFNDNEQFHCVHSRITPICDMLLPLCYDASCHLPPLLSDKTSKYRVHRQKRAKKGIINMVRLLLHPKWPKHKNTIRLGEARRIAKVDAPMFV